MTLSIREALEDMQRRHGTITAELVLAEATDKAHPLHGYFQWDDKRAAHEYRLEQARLLIRQVTIIEDGRELRAFPFVKSANRYAPLQDVLTNTDWRQEVIEDFKRQALAFEARWRAHVIAADAYRDWLSKQADDLLSV